MAQKKVLTVDDAATMRKMIAMTLKGAGYAVDEAEDGVCALEYLRSNSVDLMIVDVNMPRMNGIELVRKVRPHPRFKSVPILILTTESNEKTKALGKQAGATGWIVKPFKQDQLVSVVKHVLK